MVQIKIDRDMLLEELYLLRSLLPEASEDAKDKFNQIVSLVQNAPADLNQSTLPRINGRRRG